MSVMKKKTAHTKLGEFFATAICGNDILSSSLYVSGIAAMFAGVFAPFVMLGVVLILFFYKAVYREVVEALPLNGGAYNCLLNATSKTVAAIAGIMTILSYIATAVISAKVGEEYLHYAIPSVPVLPGTIVLLFIFALLVISGVKDSAKVALGIFIFHIISLSLFLIAGLSYVIQHGSLMAINEQISWLQIVQSGGLAKALVLSFAASLLGISGFESSANFVEEQKPGVFAKTLRNMLLGVAIFNPLIALIVLHVLPLNAIALSKDFLLADAAKVIGGTWFGYLIVADAFLVLAGAVLTAYVGVSGLVHRMTLDGCLPGILLKENRKGVHTRIIIAFFVLCSSILLITQGELLSLAGVYTISFLGVMSLFALGNLVLRETRTELKRTYSAPLPFVILAFVGTAIGVGGNILIDPRNIVYFGAYFIPALCIVLAMIYEDKLVLLSLRLSARIPYVHELIKSRSADILAGRFVVFIHHANRLYGALEYIERNEKGLDVTVVHCDNRTGDDADYNASYKEIKELIPSLQKAGVFPHFKIKTLYKKKPFNPETVSEVAKELKIHKNRILIGSIHHTHEFDFHELEGVRIISG